MANKEIKPEYKGKNAKELQELLVAKSDAFEEFIKPHRFEKDGQKSYNLTIAQAEQMRGMNDELTDIGEALDVAREVDVMTKQHERRMEQLDREPVNNPGHNTGERKQQPGQEERQVKSLGELFVESKKYKETQESGEIVSGSFKVGIEIVGVEFKTLMGTGANSTAGFAPANNRTSIVIPSAQRRPVVQDFVPQTATDLDSVKFMEETTFTNNADATAEGAALGESALAYTERSNPVELIGCTLPVTEQQLEIAETVRGLIDNRLILMEDIKVETQLLTGSGTTPQLTGFLNKSGIQTQARGSDPTPDAIYKLFQKLRGAGGDGFVEPNLVVIHPNDWTEIRLLRDGNGNYIWGNPSEAGPERIWGKPVVQTVSETENTILSGDFAMFAEIYNKRGARIDMGWMNDDFGKNRLTLKITRRLVLVIYRAAAFGKVTGA